MRILFITATRVGDAVLSTGLLDHLLRRHPEARVTIACGRAAAGVFARVPRREATLIVDKRRFDAHWFALWQRIVWVVWDLVVDLRGSAIAWTVLARRRVVMRGGRRAGHRLTHLAGCFGLAPPPLPVAWTEAADRARAAALLPEGGPILALGPTANWDGKIWPAERFVALARALQGRIGRLRVAVFGGPGVKERALAAPVLAGLPGAIDLVGGLALAEVAACFGRVALFVGNDSGLMHLAASAGAPTLGLFGPSRASEYAPAGRRVAFVAAPGVEGEAPIAGLGMEAALAACLALLRGEGSCALPS